MVILSEELIINKKIFSDIPRWKINPIKLNKYRNKNSMRKDLIPLALQPVLSNQNNGEKFWSIVDENGYIYSQEVWNSIKNKVEKFYQLVEQELGEDWIDKQNRKTKAKHKEKRKKTIKGNGKKKAKEGYVYLMEGNGNYKIGKSINPRRREHDLNKQFPFQVSLVKMIKTKDMDKLEKKLMKKFRKKRIGGEWFNLNQQEVNYICNLKNEGGKNDE